jgi:hypothetical protein
VKYTEERGEQRTFSPSGSGFGIFHPVHSVGETVDVLYDKTNSADARIASYLYRLPIELGGIAALLFFWGARVLMRTPD